MFALISVWFLDSALVILGFYIGFGGWSMYFTSGAMYLAFVTLRSFARIWNLYKKTWWLLLHFHDFVAVSHVTLMIFRKSQSEMMFTEIYCSPHPPRSARFPPRKFRPVNHGTDQLTTSTSPTSDLRSEDKSKAAPGDPRWIFRYGGERYLLESTRRYWKDVMYVFVKQIIYDNKNLNQTWNLNKNGVLFWIEEPRFFREFFFNFFWSGETLYSSHALRLLIGTRKCTRQIVFSLIWCLCLY